MNWYVCLFTCSVLCHQIVLGSICLRVWTDMFWVPFSFSCFWFWLLNVIWYSFLIVILWFLQHTLEVIEVKKNILLKWYKVSFFFPFSFSFSLPNEEFFQRIYYLIQLWVKKKAAVPNNLWFVYRMMMKVAVYTLGSSDGVWWW